MLQRVVWLRFYFVSRQRSSTKSYRGYSSSGDSWGCRFFGELRGGRTYAKCGNDDGHVSLSFDEGCASGNAMACTKLGTRYKDGSDVSTDLEIAEWLYKKGFEGGNYEGCSLLGNLYSDKGNKNKAIEYNRLECEGGYRCNTLFSEGL